MSNTNEQYESVLKKWSTEKIQEEIWIAHQYASNMKGWIESLEMELDSRGERLEGYFSENDESVHKIRHGGR